MVSTVDEFVKTVMRSGVVSRDALQATLRKVPPAMRNSPQAVADWLVSEKLLTQFQAQKLLSGIAMGLKLGPYLIQTPIGRGGMGTVYLAKDSRSNMATAIKVVSPKREKERARHLARFQREIMLSQKLRHPNIALTKDFGEVCGVHYLALEFIPGVTLHKLVTRDGPLSPPRAARLFAEICSALEHAHQKGLIHRDLKPTNLMVTPDDHAKVLDLGLALIRGEAADDPEIVGGKGYIVGSVEYMAPEQTRDPTKVDGRADLYSLGCAMYFTLTGRGPFSYGDTKDKVRAHRHQEAEPIRRRNPAVPEAFAALIHRLMAKDAAQRPASATAVRKALLPFSEPSSTKIKPSKEVEFDQVVFVPVDDLPDTLSEVFRFNEDLDDDHELPAITGASVRAQLREQRSMNGTMWMLLFAVAVVVVGVMFAVLRSTMR